MDFGERIGVLFAFLYKFHIDKSHILIILSLETLCWRKDVTNQGSIITGSIPESG